MIYAMFPGGFKPPHQGHLKVVESIFKGKNKPDILYIIISKKPRLLIPPFKKTYQMSEKEIQNISDKYHKKYDKKLLEKDATDGVIPAITAKEAYDIWKLYIKLLPDNIQDKIKVYISPFDSPIMFAYTIISKKIEKKDTLILVKSSKNKENKRFELFDALEKKGAKIIYQNIPKFDELDSTIARKYIVEKKKNKFYQFLPKTLSNQNKKLIWDMISSKVVH